MKYLLVIEYETVTPLVLMFSSIENAEILYTTDKIGKRVTLFVLESIGLIDVYKEMKTRTMVWENTIV